MWTESSTSSPAAAASTTLSLGSAKLYRITGRTIRSSSDNDNLRLTVISGSEQTSGYAYHWTNLKSSSTSYAAGWASGAAGYIELFTAAGAASYESASFEIFIADPSDTAKDKVIWWIATVRQYQNYTMTVRGSGRWTGGTGAITGLKLAYASGNTTGTFTVDELTTDDGSDGWEYLASDTLSGATTEISLGGSYEAHAVVVVNAQPATDGSALSLKVNSGGIQSSSYAYHEAYPSSSGNVYSAAVAGAGGALPLTGNIGNASNEVASGILLISKVDGTSLYKPVSWQGAGVSSVPASTLQLTAGVWKGGTGAITGLQFSMSSGNLAGGTVYIYGLKEGTATNAYQLLLHCDGTDGSTSFPDSSSGGHTVTAYGDAQVDTAQSKFGGASALFDGSGDYLGAPNNSDFDLGSGDWTIDFWLRGSNAATFQTLLTLDNSNSHGATGYAVDIFSSSSEIFCYVSDGSTQQYASKSRDIMDSTWRHIAVVRNGANLTLAVDGTFGTPTSIGAGTSLLSGQAFRAGARNAGGDPWSGHLDEIRILKGTAVWTSNFTPPTSPY